MKKASSGIARRGNGSGSVYRRGGRGAWRVTWYDAEGRRRDVSTRTTSKADAEAFLRERVREESRRAQGLVDPMHRRVVEEGRRPIGEHVADYLRHCEAAGQAERNVSQKRRQLERFVESRRLLRLADMDSDALVRFLGELKAAGRSARTRNHHRASVVAFAAWAAKDGRLASNPVKLVPKADESRDRRRRRRPLTDAELARLVAVARERGREAWYLAAALAGLRRGDLERLTWADVDFEDATITIRGGKAKRVDVLPMHPQLAEALRRHHATHPGIGRAKVFPTTVTTRTQQKDLLRAGLAREEVVRDEAGEPVMVGEGRRRRPKTRIVTDDADGRVVDLHALRTTLATQLARNGVTPQVAQRVMRHADYRTTLSAYTVLGLADSAAAIEALPRIEPDDERREAATGTTDAPASGSDLQQYRQQRQRETEHFDATRCEWLAPTGTSARDVNPTKTAPFGAASGKRVTGLEPATFSLEGCEPTSQGAASAGVYERAEADVSSSVSSSPAAESSDPRLSRVLAAWDGLPEAVRAGIAAMVDAAGGCSPAE